MIMIGIIIGFIGAGGAGVTVSILTLVFHLPIHTAVGTALGAMVFTTISGSISHFREGNIVIKPGVVLGLGGVMGAALGANLSQRIPEHILQPAAGYALWFLAFLVWMRILFASRLASDNRGRDQAIDGRRIVAGAATGTLGGMASAFFGVGMAPFIQLALMTVMRLPLIQAVGTTMLALSFISLSGALSLMQYGDLSWLHMIGVTIGLTIGSFIGAKFTRRAPLLVLKFAVVATPFLSGAALVFF